jgi:hypothetical protein
MGNALKRLLKLAAQRSITGVSALAVRLDFLIMAQYVPVAAWSGLPVYNGIKQALRACDAQGIEAV